jgi:hypothetical protein
MMNSCLLLIYNLIIYLSWMLLCRLHAKQHFNSKLNRALFQVLLMILSLSRNGILTGETVFKAVSGKGALRLAVKRKKRYNGVLDDDQKYRQREEKPLSA